jgi:peptidoglycan/LPS O-acetylase OafA/YrhL
VGDQQFPALTGIRFPLAIWVIVHHLTGPDAMLDDVVRGAPAAAQTFVHMAYVALGTFFVLSGFVLQRSYRATQWNGASITRYAVARVARFYPVYLLSLLVLAPIMYRDVSSPDLGSAADRAWLLVNYAFVLQGWDKLPVSWNTPAWSLSCELFFYLLFPLVVVVMRRGTWPRVLFTAALAFALPMSVRALGAPPTWKPLLFFGDFLAGVALAGAYDKLAARRPRLMGNGNWLYGPAAALGLTLILMEPSIRIWSVMDAGFRAVNVLLVLGLALGGGLGARLLSTPGAVLAGKATYAIYILHIPLLWWYKRMPLYQSLPGPAAAMIFIAAVVTLSIAVYLLLEEPANRLLRRRGGAQVHDSRRTPREVGLRARRAASEAA